MMTLASSAVQGPQGRAALTTSLHSDTCLFDWAGATGDESLARLH